MAGVRVSVMLQWEEEMYESGCLSVTQGCVKHINQKQEEKKATINKIITSKQTC